VGVSDKKAGRSYKENRSISFFLGKGRGKIKKVTF